MLQLRFSGSDGRRHCQRMQPGAGGQRCAARRASGCGRLSKRQCGRYTPCLVNTAPTAAVAAVVVHCQQPAVDCGVQGDHKKKKRPDAARRRRAGHHSAVHSAPAAGFLGTTAHEVRLRRRDAVRCAPGCAGTSSMPQHWQHSVLIPAKRAVVAVQMLSFVSLVTVPACNKSSRAKFYKHDQHQGFSLQTLRRLVGFLGMAMRVRSRLQTRRAQSQLNVGCITGALYISARSKRCGCGDQRALGSSSA